MLALEVMAACASTDDRHRCRGGHMCDAVRRGEDHQQYVKQSRIMAW